MTVIIFQNKTSCRLLTSSFLEEFVECRVEFLRQRVEQAARGDIDFGVDGVVFLAQVLEHFGAGRQNFMLVGLFHDITKDSEDGWMAK